MWRQFPFFRRSKWSLIVRYSCIALLLAVVVTLACFAALYRGFASDLVNDIKLGSWQELRTKYAFLRYYARYYAKLQLNESNNMYDLEKAAARAHSTPGTSGFELALLDYHRGLFTQSITELEADIHSRGETEEKLFWLAMSYLRAGEAENCQKRISGNDTTPSDSIEHAMYHNSPMIACSLPLKRFHDKKEWSETAAKEFQRLLERYNPDNDIYRWLLNFCYMTIDQFPDGVPPRYRIETPFIDAFYGATQKAIAAKHPDLKLEDHAHDLGVDAFQAGKGVAVEDFNGDGWLDIVTGGTFSGLHYYENDHGVRFIDKTVEAGLSNITQAYMITAADYDNDGKMDLFVSRPFQHFVLLHNNGDGTFTDATLSSGLLSGEPSNDEAYYTCVSAWADVNNDGRLDLFIAQFAERIPFAGGLLGRKPISSKLFINVGNGHFVDKTAEYGLSDIVDDAIFVGAAFGDYDGDGWPDLFLSSPSRNKSVLLKNIDGKRFVRTSLIDTAEPGFTAAFLDIDHDGHLDLFQGSMAVAAPSVSNAVFRRNPQKFANKIFLQRAGSFETRIDFFEGGMPIGTMGASYGDINNDGCYDFYLGSGSPESWFILPNMLYLGESDGTACTGRMENISMLFGTGAIQKGHAIVFADFNNDGLQDIYSSLGGMWPGDAWRSQLFINKSTTKNTWIKIRLRGRQTNYFGVGASIRVAAENQKGQPIIRTYSMDSKTGFGSAPYLAHIGLMDAVVIRDVAVRWPVSKKTKHYTATIQSLNILDENAGSEVSPDAQLQSKTHKPN